MREITIMVNGEIFLPKYTKGCFLELGKFKLKILNVNYYNSSNGNSIKETDVFKIGFIYTVETKEGMTYEIKEEVLKFLEKDTKIGDDFHKRLIEVQCLFGEYD